MSQRISEMLFSQLTDFVAAQMGLHFPRERWRDLERGIGFAAREFHFEDLDSCIHWLLESPLRRSQIEVLASHLTVGESYFFRDRQSFQILEEQILPELIRSRRNTEQPLRIWCAGCASGEEPYSIAILLSKLIPDLQDWNVTILATDINPGFLQRASEGVYGNWSFRETPAWIQEKYFRKTKSGSFEILPELKKIVIFSYLNLAEDAYPSFWSNTNAMDVIFCRNVLMYFVPEKVKKVIENLYRSLGEGGWLIVSPTEAPHFLFSRFATINFPGAIFYRKDSSKPPSAGIFPSWPVQESTVTLQPLSPLAAESTPEISIPAEIGELPQLVVEEAEKVEEQATAYRKALALYEEGKYVEAAQKLVQASSQNQADAKAMALLARVYANQGQLSQALEWCEKAIAADKLNAGFHYLCAIILLEQGAWEGAKLELKRALYLDQEFALAHVALGNLVQRQGKVKQARKHFDTALSLLRLHGHEDILPESEGITAGRLAEIIRSTTCSERSL